MVMKRRGERGKGRISTVFWLLVVAALVYAGYYAGPAFVEDYQFRDSLDDISRTGLVRDHEQVVRDRVEKAIKELKLNQYLSLSSCRITMEETTRTIFCEYNREIQFLPGIRRTWHFTDKVKGSAY
jgi:hypothetical protein